MEEQKNSVEQNLKDILEIVGAIKDGMATKDDLRELRDELVSEIQGIKAELEDIKESLSRLEKRTREDSDAGADDILDLRRRVQELEQQFKKLQSAKQTA